MTDETNELLRQILNTNQGILVAQKEEANRAAEFREVALKRLNKLHMSFAYSWAIFVVMLIPVILGVVISLPTIVERLTTIAQHP